MSQLLYNDCMKKGGKRRLEGSDQLGQRIKALRVRKNLTQLELARLVGISPTHISAIEIGKVTNPGIELIQRIAEALETTILLGGETARSLAIPTLAYESPFIFEHDSTSIVRSVLSELADLLQDPAISTDDRARIAEQLLSYARWQRDDMSETKTP